MVSPRNTALIIGYVLLTFSIAGTITLLCYAKDAVEYLPPEKVPVYFAAVISIFTNAIIYVLLVAGVHLHKRRWVKIFLITQCVLFVTNLIILIIFGEFSVSILPSTMCFIAIMAAIERYYAQMEDEPVNTRPPGYNTIEF